MKNPPTKPTHSYLLDAANARTVALNESGRTLLARAEEAERCEAAQHEAAQEWEHLCRKAEARADAAELRVIEYGACYAARESEAAALRAELDSERCERVQLEEHESKEVAALRVEVERLRDGNAFLSRELGRSHASLAEARALLRRWLSGTGGLQKRMDDTESWLTANSESPRVSHSRVGSDMFVLDESTRAAAERSVLEECNCPRDNMYDSSRTGWCVDCPKHGLARRVVKQ